LKRSVNCVKQNWDGSHFLSDAMGTLLGKLVFQLQFYYLYSLQKLKWSLIKATAREWACITSLKLEKSHRLFAVQK